MSGAQTYAGPNVLYDPLVASRQTSAENVLMQQQQNISEHQIEMGARLASTLLDPTVYPTTEARAAAYPSLVANARRQYPGYFTNAPATYPGDEATAALARMGTPSADLFKLGIDRTAKGSIAPGDDGTTATGGTGRAAPATGGDGLTGDKAHDLPLIAQRESGGNPTVLNYVARGDPSAYARGATASGKYQIVNSTWREGMQLAGLDPAQYATARDAPEQVQDKVASAIYDKYGNKPWQKGPQDWVKDEQGRYQMATVRPAAGALGGAPSVTAPGGATAASPAPGVQMGGAVPPPPGGAPGAYGGGGMGVAIGGQPAGARATIPAGRPTAPPVITDQPAGSNVVAGPPGVATVGAPQPPGPAVPGNVAAINAGIAGAGGQPVTDPNLTPTPARYAGTAPAPSVEAAPETGWGSQVGSGYGPQNALAPAPVPPAATRPAAPAAAQPAAQQPPAADTLPPLPAPTPPAPTNRNGLNAAQQQDIERRRGMPNVSADELQKRVDSYVSANAAAVEKYQQDNIAYVREARERQSAAQAQQDRAQAQQLAREAAQRDAERLKLSQQADQRAADKAKQEADAAGRPLQGNDVDIQHERILNDLADKIRDGTATEAEKRLYSGSYYALQQKGGQAVQITDPNNPGGTIAATITRRLPPSLPEPPGGALPQVFTTPGAAKAPEMTAPQSQAAGFADRMRNALPVISDTSPAAMNRWQQVLGQIPLIGNAYVSADFQRHLQSERDFINAVLRRESGAAISESEFVNARQQYIPQPGDKPPVLADKARNRETVLANLVRDAGPAYRPPTGSTTQQSTTTPPTRVIRYDHTGKRIEE